MTDDMGVIATNKREIKLFYNAETNKGMQTLAYLKSSQKKVLDIDLSKTKVTGTQWTELAKLLGKPIKDLINTEHPDFIKKYGNYAMVTGFKQSTLDHRQFRSPTNCVEYHFPNGDSLMSYLPMEFEELKDTYGGQLFRIAARIEGNIVSNFNSHWYTGGDTVNWYDENRLR